MTVIRSLHSSSCCTYLVSLPIRSIIVWWNKPLNRSRKSTQNSLHLPLNYQQSRCFLSFCQTIRNSIKKKKIQGKSCVIVISIRLEREPKRHDRLRAWWRGFRCQPGRSRERNNNKSRQRNWKRVRTYRRKGTSQVPIVTQSSVIRYTASLFVYIRNIKNKSRRRKKDARVYISEAAGSAADVATETVGRAFGFEIRPSTTLNGGSHTSR